MKKMMWMMATVGSLLIPTLVFTPAGQSAEAPRKNAVKEVPKLSGFPPIKDSFAYKQFMNRKDQSDLSKLIYLIDRFSGTDIQVVYDGISYKSAFAAGVAKWFLARKYSKETVNEWILKWCNRTILAGNLIWVKFPDGATKLSREVLTNEVKALEKLLSEEKAQKVAEEQKKTNEENLLKIQAPVNDVPATPIKSNNPPPTQPVVASKL